MTKDEIKKIEKIKKKYYMKPILKRAHKHIDEKGIEETFNYIHEILTGSQTDVEKLLKKRKRDGKINDIPQARKSVVGAAFSNILVYLFLTAKKKGLVRENIFISDNGRNKMFEKMVSINVDGETQKPDMDIIIYSRNRDASVKKLIIISLKTSLRERAGQTYKWKLLLEIATTKNDIKDKYNIKYDVSKMPLVCFATVNFYNEINNPQHKGMFKFFDNSFIGKPLKADFINNLSSIISYSNKNL
ncbi:hypothetical protein KKB40_00275 [Patescibacteria group bacterium]|nr:hypothetical protein [Patescibacteria group bacterium]